MMLSYTYNTATDELHLLMEVCERYLEESNSEIIHIASQAESLARTTGDDSSWAKSLQYLGAGGIIAGDYNSAIQTLGRGLAVFRFQGDTFNQWLCFLLMASAWSRLGNGELYQKARNQAATVQGAYTKPHWFSALNERALTLD